MRAAVATALLLLIVAQAMRRGPGIAARVATLAARGRGRTRYGWALGTAVTFALPALLALLLVGRADALWTMPPELIRLAWGWGLPAATGPDLPWLFGSLALGAAIGTAALLMRRRLGRGSWGLAYRSPAAARNRCEWGGAAAIAVAAGVGEEAFFRLALPLVAGLATGSMAAGLALATIAFGLAHRHQGWAGMVATTLVGAALAWVYLWTGALWVAMLLHVVVDLNALILRPWLDRPLRPA